MLDALLPGMQAALGPDLVGVYLRGSLALSDFDPVTSDIDFLAVTERPVAGPQFAALAELHGRLAALPNPYAHHLEGSYIDRLALRRFGPGERRHPSVGSDWVFDWGDHGGDWVFERWIVRERGIILLGPDPRTLIEPIPPQELRDAAREQLRWWAALPDVPRWLLRRDYQAFAIETMCRAHFTLRTGELPSKPRAVAWAFQSFPEVWRQLIEYSRSWRTDKTSDPKTLPEVMRFVRWAAREGEQIPCQNLELGEDGLT